MSGWKIGTEKYKETEDLFKSIWATLELLADIDHDGKITKDEWVYVNNIIYDKNVPIT